MKKFFFYLTPILGLASLVGCAGQNVARNPAGTYGQLESFTQITTYSAESLQAFTQGTNAQGVTGTGVCSGVNSGSATIDAAACNINTQYVNNQTESFGAINVATFIPTSASVTAYRLIYNTPGQPLQFTGNTAPTETVSGLLLLPNASTTIKGIVLYYHPTVFSKNDIPSGSTVDSTAEQKTLAAIYAAQGYIVVAPDYVGQGVNIAPMHPYVLYPENNALSGLYMLSAARQFLANNSILSIPTTTPLNLYISSYSEGGAYALFAERILHEGYSSAYIDLYGHNYAQSPNMTLKMTAGISGAYNLESAMLPYAYNNSNNFVESLNIYHVSPGLSTTSQTGQAFRLELESAGKRAGITGLQNLPTAYANFYYVGGAKSSLSSYAFASFITYNFNNNVAYSILYQNQDFVAMNKCLNVPSYLGGNTQFVSCGVSKLQDLFNNPNYVESQIAPALYASALGSTFTSTGFMTTRESIGVVLGSFFVGQPIFNNSIGNFANPITDSFIEQYIKPANTWSFTATSPISLIYLNYDSVVTNLNSKHACGIGGVGQLSANNMVTCLNVDNTQMYTTTSLPIPTPTNPTAFPIMLDHGSAEFILNLVALNQFNKTP